MLKINLFDKVKIINRLVNNQTGLVDYKKKNGDVGKTGYIKEVDSSYPPTSYCVYSDDGSDSYLGWFKDEEIKLIKTKPLVSDKNGFLREEKISKLNFTLIPHELIEDLTRHYTEGAIEHGVDNWKKALNTQQFKESFARHAHAWINDLTTIEKGEEETPKYHAMALVWNLFSYIWHTEYKQGELRKTKTTTKRGD